MIYVVGHKSPDTDAVISAIAYSVFKKYDYVPVIAGEINDETKFVLEKFSIEVPKKLEKVREKDMEYP